MMCQRCGVREVQPPFKAYCSDACRDSLQRAMTKLRKAQAQALPKARISGRFRIYPPPP